ncbi:hypothetical protein E3E38_09765 [Thermococcus sp. 18S1]|uniref:immunoglobulin-like domain-containing protein n=1 Tax=Thermococcus sp. 18S1 TaxID=1638210 RepID=UPI00143C7E7A|nr:immunoglobulin-like domain-containing protein [Thermococcus sp. 18S1]NJE31327.1 hypothetical protein [Thermococcus sp. 18S1]
MNRALVVFAVFVLLLGILYAGTRETAKNLHSDAGTALMRLDKGTYRVGEDLTLMIINTGSETLLVGSFYRLYRFENGRWNEIPLGFSFTGIGYMIWQGQSWTQTIPLMVEKNGKLDPIPPGRYLIEKTVIIDRGRCGGRSDEIRLSAEFEVVE